jgi:patatin-like phospholipase/acyl hydrolase
MEKTNNPKKYTKLVLAGGGTLGYSYIGVLKKLEELSIIKDIDSIVATSIGSIIALFIILGYSSTELEDIFTEYNYKINNDIKIKNFIEKFGFNDGENILKLLKIFLKNKKFNENVTFEQLFKKTGKNLIVTACNINKAKTVFFDRINYPNMPCIIAIRASISVPFVFTPLEYLGDLYIDGGLTSNIPIKYFSDISLGKISYDEILCVIFKFSYNSVDKNIDSLDKYIMSFLKIFLKEARNNHEEYIIKNNIDSIELNVKNNNKLDFCLTKDEKKTMIDYGYTYSTKFFNSKKNKTVE